MEIFIKISKIHAGGTEEMDLVVIPEKDTK